MHPESADQARQAAQPPRSRGPTAPVPRVRARPRWWFRLVLFAVVIGCTAVAAELALRIWWTVPPLLGAFQEQPLYRAPEPGAWEMRPGLDLRFEWELVRTAYGIERTPDDTPLQMRTNSIGLRGPELGVRAAGECRVLVVGDSLAFGHFMQEDECFAGRLVPLLERELAAPVVVANGGVPGYGLVATSKRMRRLLPEVEPDAIVACVCLGNDLMEDVMQLAVAVSASKAFRLPLANVVNRTWRGDWAAHSRLWLFGEYQLLRLLPSWSLLPYAELSPEQLAAGAGLPNPHQAVDGLFLDAIDEQHPWQLGGLLERTKGAFAAMQRDAAGRPLLVVVCPTLRHLDDAERAAAMAAGGLDPALHRAGRGQQRLLDLCAQLSLPALDATPSLAAAGPPQALYLKGDTLHFSVAGNQVVAEAIARALLPLLRR